MKVVYVHMETVVMLSFIQITARLNSVSGATEGMIYNRFSAFCLARMRGILCHASPHFISLLFLVNISYTYTLRAPLRLKSLRQKNRPPYI